MNDAPIRLQPVVRWPRKVRPNTRYQVIVDLTVEDGQEWPYPAEEQTIGCLLDGEPWGKVESVGSDLLVLHRFGGTYGPIRFVLHVAELRTDPRPLRLTFLTSGGIPFRTVELPVSRGEAEKADKYDDVPGTAAEPPRTGTVTALLVGINDAGPGRRSIGGAVNDIEMVHRLLQSMLTPLPGIHMLLDAAATRDAIVTRLRALAEETGPDDSVLFWFSGNGSAIEAPSDQWHLYPTGKIQTLICHGPGEDRSEITAPELSDLIGRITDNGTHVAVVVDACHGALKPNARAEPPSEPGQPHRRVPPSESGRDAGSHVLLSACRSHESAMEIAMDGQFHGVFSWALVRAIRRLGPAATYRELITAARRDVANMVEYQTPALYPPTDPAVDQPFLGGATKPPASPIVMYRGRDGWQINIGECHGAPVVTGTRVAVVNTTPPREAEVVDVRMVDSLVEPDGWEPDPGIEYPVVLSTMLAHPTTFAVETVAGIDTEDSRFSDPSPYVREATSGEIPDLDVVVQSDSARILMRAALERMTFAIKIDGRKPRIIADALDHVARWRSTYLLDNPSSSLREAVRIEVVPSRPGQAWAPADSTSLRPDRDGLIRLHAQRTAGIRQPPALFVRLRNTRDEHLYCALLGLTTEFGVDVRLFPGDFIGPYGLAAAMDGRPIPVPVPVSDRRRWSRDAQRMWLRLIVCQREFSVEPFALPALDGDISAAPLRPLYNARSAPALAPGPPPSDPSTDEEAVDWWTTMIPIAVVDE
ncbi:caspase family protein [Actinoplanes hulinensis]|uniref:Caspase family protein n=1 Tax=Actinoplanes hulinensis TaxID=1144547 RepID=A0ABS7AZF9_9ACTN|nr:caspase family protein [Actinoplanes hulinensis]MBW6433554.1 caspase family protein [Actinoplanes hulinensis]